VRDRIVVVGASKGGLTAMERLLSGIADRFSWPLVIAQHRMRDTRSDLCGFLQRFSALPVREPNDKDPIDGGAVYLAPADYHLLVEDHHFALSTDSPSLYARPSINYLFESAVESYADCVIGVILTGTNSDGALGIAAVKKAGGTAVVEDPETASAPEMPRAAIAAARVDHVLKLDEIAPFLNQLCIGEARDIDGV
jgi:two-component system, chemotaxis family, protein-glutamate methylesterase/glutaminase